MAHLIDYVHRKYLSHEIDGPGFEDRQVRETSFLQNRPDQYRCSLSLRFAGYWGSLSGGVKRPWSEVDHSPPSSAYVKNA